jgi:hypothetical protein
MQFKVEKVEGFKQVKVELTFETIDELIAFNKRINLCNSKVNSVAPDYYASLGNEEWVNKRELWNKLNEIIKHSTGVGEER